MMAAATLIQLTCCDPAILCCTALRTLKPFRPTPLEQGLVALLFGSIILEQLKQAITCLELNFIFNHSCNLLDLLTFFDSIFAVKLLRLVGNQEQVWLITTVHEQFHLAIKLLIIYGCRLWELCGALKQEFDFDAMIWSIPPERVKNQRWLILPITPFAKKLLDRLWLYSGNSIYLFPGRYDEETTIHKTSLSHAIRRIKDVEKFSPRDLRRTVKTRMGEIGIEKSIRDRIQNHALTDVSSKHYDRYDYLQEKRAALLTWEKYLLELTES
jgi:integrase